MDPQDSLFWEKNVASTIADLGFNTDGFSHPETFGELEQNLNNQIENLAEKANNMKYADIPYLQGTGEQIRFKSQVEDAVSNTLQAVAQEIAPSRVRGG